MNYKRGTKDNMAYLFNRYVWLCDLIYRKEKLTYNDINREWIKSSLNYTKKELPLKTFQNHRIAIQEMFDLNIECNRKDGYYYYIENIDDLKTTDIREMLINTFSINNLIQSAKRLKKQILFEKIPGGNKYLINIIEAIRDCQELSFVYKTFDETHNKNISIHPYGLKVFKQRWYLVGNNIQENDIRIYSLDRVVSISKNEKYFSLPHTFNIKKYFNDSYGIFRNDSTSVGIIKLRAYGVKAAYLKALPLHHSQRIDYVEKDFTIFEYRVKPTYDFRQEILSHGDEIEVIYPEEFRREISNIIEKQYKRYINH